MSFSLPQKEYFTIGEVSDLTQVPPYVLRYWEAEFSLLRPLRRESGHRKFSRKDLELVQRIKDLLYVKGFTIAGAKKYIQQENRKGPEQLKIELAENGAAVELLKETKETLEEILKVLR